MKLVTLARYVRHPLFRDSNPLTGAPAVHAMMRRTAVVVDANAFLCAVVKYSDASYPDEPDTAIDVLVSATFAKGGASINIETKASELARVMGKNSLPGRWLGRYGREALEPRV